MKNTKIEWCDHTFKPWIGCTKVSPGCANCYAEAHDHRWGNDSWGHGKPRRRTSAANWKQPLRWDREAYNAAAFHASEAPLHDEGDFAPYVRPRVFCASLADWLDDEVPIEWLANLLDLIRRTPNLDWLLLTKRPENWKERLDSVLDFEAIPADDDPRQVLSDWILDWYNGKPPANVWIGTTVEDQERADQRIPELLKIPAHVRFLSCEPLLGPVELDDVPLDDRCYGPWEGPKDNPVPGIHWVICGGESGPKARPMLIEWADDLRRQCAAAGVPFFMKQLGAYVGTTNANAHDWPEHVAFEEVPGTPQIAGARVRLSDKIGRNIEEFPSELQIRQFPLEFKRVYP